MKRFLCLSTVLLLSSLFIFAQEIEYRCIERTYGSTSEYIKAGVKTNGICIYPNDKIIFHKGNSFNLSGDVRSGYRYYDNIPVLYAECNNGEKCYFNLDMFVVAGSDKLPGIKYDESYEYKKQSVTMVASYYFDILKKNDISAIYEYEPFWKDNEWITPNDHFSDYYSAHRYFVISNTYISSNKRDCRPNSKEIYRVGLDYGALIKEIKKINENLYTIKVFCREDRFDSSTNFIDEFVDLYKNDENTFYLEYDGDYVKISLNEKNNVIGTYVIITSDIDKQLNDIACGRKADLSDITWPHHADGTSEYEDTIRYPEQIAIEEPEQTEVEEYDNTDEETTYSDSQADNIDCPPFPSKEDSKYWDILEQYYPEDYEKLRFEYLQKRTKVINTVVISCSIIFGIIIIIAVVFTIIRKQRTK